jgi:hypothetical protein
MCRDSRSVVNGAFVAAPLAIAMLLLDGRPAWAQG